MKPKKVFYSGLEPVERNQFSIFLDVYNDSVDGGKIVKVGRDSTEAAGDIILDFIVPYDDGEGFSAVNDENTLLVRTTYIGSSFLFAGGCGLECEDRVSNSFLLTFVLKAANQGSCDANTLFFLTEVLPQITIVGDNVCPKTLSNLETLESDVLDVFTLGDVMITTDGSSYAVGVRKAE